MQSTNFMLHCVIVLGESIAYSLLLHRIVAMKVS